MPPLSTIACKECRFIKVVFLFIIFFCLKTSAADTLHLSKQVIEYGKTLAKINTKGPETPANILHLQDLTTTINTEYSNMQDEIEVEEKPSLDSFIQELTKFNNKLQKLFAYSKQTIPPDTTFGIDDTLSNKITELADLLQKDLVFPELSPNLNPNPPQALVAIKIKIKPKKWIAGAKKLVSKGVELVKKGVNRLLGLLPAEVKKEASKFFGECARFNGQVIEILNDAQNKVIGTITLEGLALLNEFADKEDEILKKVDKYLKEGAKILPPDVEKEFNVFLNDCEAAIKVVTVGFQKALEVELLRQKIQYKIIDAIAQFLQISGKYLAMSSDGFPKSIALPNENLSNSKAMIFLKDKMAEILMQNSLKYEYQTGGRTKFIAYPGQMKIDFDDATQSFIVELNNSKVRFVAHLDILKFEFDPKASLEIKTLRFQLLPSIVDRKLQITSRIIFLDIDNVPKKIEEMMAWYFQDNYAGAIIDDLGMDKLLQFHIDLANGLPHRIEIPDSLFNYKRSINEKKLFFGLSNSKNNSTPINPTDFSDIKGDMGIAINSSFIKDIIDTILKTYGGIYIIPESLPGFLKRKKGRFHLQALNTIEITNDNLYLNFKGRAYIKRFFWKERSFLATSIPLFIYPRITKEDTIYKINLAIKPDIDHFTIKHAPNGLIRIAIKLFTNLDKHPIHLNPIDGTNAAALKVDHPYVSNVNIFPRPVDFKLEFNNHKLFLWWKFIP